MKEYFYENDGKQFGPVDIESLKIIQITGETLIWFEGLPEWTRAKEIQELSDIIKKLPPPLPNKEKGQVFQRSKYDLTYAKETDASWAGFAFLTLPIFLTMTGVFRFTDEQSFLIAKVIGSVLSIVYRIAITFWVTGIANRQNRDTLGWGIFAFLIPTIALIIIGFLNRLNKPDKPTYAELIKSQIQQVEAKSDKEFKEQDNLLRIISFGLIIIGIIGVILLIIIQ